MYASDELIEDSNEVDVVNFIIRLFSEAIGDEEDRVITAGNGTTEPTGYSQAAGVNSITCSGNLDFDDIINLEFELPQKYHRNAKFYAHRNNIREMRKLKDDNNRYLWEEPVSKTQPATFHGYYVVEDNNLGEDEIYFGDLKQAYWLGDRKKMTVKISQDTETALNIGKRSINWVNCWKTLIKLGQSATKHLSKWQMKVQSIGFETAYSGI